MPSNWKLKRQLVGERDGFICRECGVTEDLTLDHVIPKAWGGSNAIGNLQLLCSPCNNKKGDSLPDGVQGLTRRRRRPEWLPPHPWLNADPVVTVMSGEDPNRFPMKVPLSTFFPRGDREMKWIPGGR